MCILKNIVPMKIHTPKCIPRPFLRHTNCPGSCMNYGKRLRSASWEMSQFTFVLEFLKPFPWRSIVMKQNRSCSTCVCLEQDIQTLSRGRIIDTATSITCTTNLERFPSPKFRGGESGFKYFGF